VDYYYSVACGTCEQYTHGVLEPLIEYYAKNHSHRLCFTKKDVTNSTYYDEWRSYGFYSYPAIVVHNETAIPKGDLTYEEVKRVIDAYLQSSDLNETFDETTIDIPFVGRINTSSLSLPVLTVVLGCLDSFNPCSFFILLFLLNLLIYVRSRKRMLLVGGIFIFFSGFFYFLFMFVLFNSLLVLSSYIGFISVSAGIVALSIGFINIKDFFFQKGPSLSIPEHKKPSIYKKMRNLVKTTHFPALIGGTVFLAVTVNFYELLCTLGFPLVFTNRLTFYSLSYVEYYAYIFLYNVVYVIPLAILLLIFIFTLGRMKLSEWQGQKLKLLSGIMVSTFGVLFITNYKLLENVITPLVLLLFSIAATLFISFVWKKTKKG
jgi:hypothetical protein